MQNRGTNVLTSCIVECEVWRMVGKSQEVLILAPTKNMQCTAGKESVVGY